MGVISFDFTQSCPISICPTCPECPICPLVEKCVINEELGYGQEYTNIEGMCEVYVKAPEQPNLDILIASILITFAMTAGVSFVITKNKYTFEGKMVAGVSV